MHSKEICLAVWGLFAALLTSLETQAQIYPSKPIRIITSSAVGSGVDTLSRIFSAELEKRLGQSVFVESRPGGNQTIGTRAAINSAPDGYALFINSLTTHPVLIKTNSIDTTKELAAISTIIFFPLGVFTTASLPLRSLGDVVAYAKANPGKMNYASPANPGLDLTMAILAERAGFSYTTITYKSAADVARSILVGEAHITATGIQSSLPNVKSGKANALMVLSDKRSSLLPDVPTAEEVGIRGLDHTGAVTLWAPIATSKDILRKLSVEAIALAKIPEYIQKVTTSFGAAPVGNTPEEALRFVEQEIRTMEEAARLINFQPQ